MAWTAFRLALRLFWWRMPILLLGNVLWLLLSLPIVTMPAATGGLFYLVQRIIMEERELDPEFARVQDFWVGFRTLWRRSTALVLLDVAVLVPLVVAVVFYWNSPIEPLRWLVGPTSVILLAWVGIQLYLFPIMLAYPERSVLDIGRSAFLLVLSYPGYTTLLVIWMCLLTAICVVLAGPVLLILFALLAVVQSMALRLIRVTTGEVETIARPETPRGRRGTRR